MNALVERFRRARDDQRGGERRGNGDRPRANPDCFFQSWDKDGDVFVSKGKFDSRPRFRGRNGRGAAPSDGGAEGPSND